MPNRVGAIALACIKSVPRRATETTAMTIGIAITVGVIATTGALSGGLSDTLGSTASERRAVVLSPGARFAGVSALDPSQVRAISQASGVARTGDGSPAVSKDVRITVALPHTKHDVLSGVVVRGLSPAALERRPQTVLVEGRMFKSGAPEVIVGRRAQSQFQSTAIGDAIAYNDIGFKVVGVFESGDWYESGFLCDADSLLRATGRENVQAMVVELENQEAFHEFADHLGTLNYQVLREPDYYDRLDDAWSARLLPATRFIAVIMAIGGVFCVFALAEYSVAARSDDLGKLQHLGAGPFGMFASVLTGPLLAGVVGALASVAVAWLLFDGVLLTTAYWDSSVVHELRISTGTVLTSLIWACLVAFGGALPTAIRAAQAHSSPPTGNA